MTLQVAVVLGPRAEHPRGGGSSVQHEDLRRKRSMYLSSKTLEDATVSCPLGEYAVGYLQCIVLKTQHNVESCGREVSTRTYPDWVDLAGTPVKDFLSWVD